MQRYCFSALLLGGLACYSVALPQELRATPAIFERSADASSTSSAPAVVSSDVESIDRKKNEKICVQYYPEQGNPTDPNNPLSVQQQCMNICGNATQKTEDDGQMHSVACISFNQPWCDATSTCFLFLFMGLPFLPLFWFFFEMIEYSLRLCTNVSFFRR